MAVDDQGLDANALIAESQFHTRQRDAKATADNVNVDNILVDNPGNIVDVGQTVIAQETDGANEPPGLNVYIPTENNLVSFVQPGANEDLNIPNIKEQPTSPNDRQTNHPNKPGWQPDNTSNQTVQPQTPGSAAAATACPGNPPYFEDDYVMNHYVCLHTHFTRKHAAAAGLPTFTHPNNVPYNYGAKGVIIKVWPGGNKDSPLSSAFRSAHGELARTRLPENKIYKINID